MKKLMLSAMFVAFALAVQAGDEAKTKAASAEKSDSCCAKVTAASCPAQAQTMSSCCSGAKAETTKAACPASSLETTKPAAPGKQTTAKKLQTPKAATLAMK